MSKFHKIFELSYSICKKTTIKDLRKLCGIINKPVLKLKIFNMAWWNFRISEFNKSYEIRVFWGKNYKLEIYHTWSYFSVMWPVSGIHCANDVKDVKTRMLQQKQQGRQWT